VSVFPTLLVVDGEGHELARQRGFDSDIGKWIALWSVAGGSKSKLEAQVDKHDVRALWALAARAEANHDAAERRRRLAAIEKPMPRPSARTPRAPPGS
jgi:hypothetical protein